MPTLLVADVGNSRIKWGRGDDRSTAEAVALPLDDPHAWDRQFQAWQLSSERWILAGVNPPALQRLTAWLTTHGGRVCVLDSYRKLPVQVAVPAPERVGIDRLLNAVAASSRDRAGLPAILVDAGSAVTVDYLDAAHVFRGGAIYPGLRLMAQALHNYTAQLPLVDVPAEQPHMPGASTTAAIAGGIFGAVTGGVGFLGNQLVSDLSAETRRETIVYLTGGDAPVLVPTLEPLFGRLGLPMEHWPFMTLDGIRLAVRSA